MNRVNVNAYLSVYSRSTYAFYVNKGLIALGTSHKREKKKT